MKISSIKAFIKCSVVTLWILQLSAVLPAESQAANSVEIAFLEDVCDSPGPNNNYSTIVRLAFVSHDSIWRALEHDVKNSEELHAAAKKFTGDRQWFLIDHNIILGKVASTGVGTYKWYKEIGMQKLISELPEKAKSPRNAKYSGWLGCPVRKPLILSTAQPAPDKERWTKEIVDVVPTNAFAEQLKNLNLDLYEGDGDEPRKANFSAKDLMVNEQYGSLSRGKLIALQFRPKSGVMNNWGEPDSSLYWFYIAKNNSIKFVGSDLVLIDWADYNSDGKTDFLFWVDGYNLNGYLVAFDNFGQTASFTWNYH